jgi:hypothetical protein
MRNPSGLVPFPPEGHRREIGRIRLYEQTIPWDQTHQVVVRPFVESDDPAERDVPSRVQRELRQRMGARVAMQDSEDSGGSSIANGGPGVVFRISRVDNQRLAHLRGERNLRRERGALGLARRIVVVIIESALADCYGRTADQLAQLRDIARRLECCCVVGMDSGGRKHEPWIVRREPGRDRRRSERFSDADDRSRARDAGARDYRVAVAGECRVREVGVAVDED